MSTEAATREAAAEPRPAATDEVLVLEGIEKFIGQKIDVQWADDDLFVPDPRTGRSHW